MTATARTRARAYLRTYNVDGVRASGPSKPDKREGISAFDAVCDEVDVARLLANSAAAGRRALAAVRVRATGNVDIGSGLTNGTTINGVVVATGDRVFLPAQSTPSQNGIYPVVASGAASRATDADGAAELARCEFLVREGTVGAGESWHLPLEASAITVGTTALTFVQSNIVSPGQAENETRLTFLEGFSRRVFRPTVTDPLLLDTVKDAVVVGAFGDEGFYLNVQFYDYGSAPYNKWFKANLHNAAGTLIANRDWTNFNAGSPPTWVFLTRYSDGAAQSNYQGIVGCFQFDWDAVAALGWNDLLTTHSTLAAAGLEPSCNRPPEYLDRFLADRVEPWSTDLIDETGFSGSVAEACSALLIVDVDPVSRSTFPNSDVCNPAAPRLIKAHAALDEAIVPVTIADISNGLIQPDYSEIDLGGGRLYIPADAALSDAPVVEQNRTGRIRNGRLRNYRNGYCVHIDEQQISRRAVSSPTVLRFSNVHLLEDLELICDGTLSTSSPIGAAVGNGMRFLARRCYFGRGGGTAPLAVFHTVPNTTDAGEVGFENCEFDPAFVAVQFLKTDNGAIRHKVWFRGCTGGAIQCDIKDGVTGGHAFVRKGPIAGFTSVSANLNP